MLVRVHAVFLFISTLIVHNIQVLVMIELFQVLPDFRTAELNPLGEIFIYLLITLPFFSGSSQGRHSALFTAISPEPGRMLGA